MTDGNRTTDAEAVTAGSMSTPDRTVPTFCTLLASARGCSFDEATGLLTLRGGPWDGHCLQETRPGVWELVPASIWHAA